MYRLAWVRKMCWVYTLVANELTAEEGGRWKWERQENTRGLRQGRLDRTDSLQNSLSGDPLTSCLRASACNGSERGGHWDTQTMVATVTEEKVFSAAQSTKKKRGSLPTDPHFISRVIWGNILLVVLRFLMCELGMMIILGQVVSIK